MYVMGRACRFSKMAQFLMGGSMKTSSSKGE
jgi:hypothetical protein